MRTKVFSVLVMLFMIAAVSQAQDYNASAGLRLGYPWAVSYKKFVSSSSAFEAFAGFRGYSGFNNVLNIGLLYQIHKDIDSVDRLKWYYGFGGNLSLGGGYSSIGISGNIGLDYSFSDAPVNISLDWVPTFILGKASYNGFGGDFGGLTARYILN